MCQEKWLFILRVVSMSLREDETVKLISSPSILDAVIILLKRMKKFGEKSA